MINPHILLQNFRFPANDPDGIKGQWSRYAPHGIPAPECRETQFTRDNHLGNGVDGNPNRFNWTVPDIDEDKCVMRIRYVKKVTLDRAPDKVRKTNFNLLYLCYFFTKSYV